MIAGDARNCGWLTAIEENKSAIVIMEGVSMYLTVDEMRNLADRLCTYFESIMILVDAYTSFAAKMSKRRNPINDVGVINVYGIDNPQDYQIKTTRAKRTKIISVRSFLFRKSLALKSITIHPIQAIKPTTPKIINAK
jgi:O-methyltransferase involved in polyketide biosynthesis